MLTLTPFNDKHCIYGEHEIDFCHKLSLLEGWTESQEKSKMAENP